VRKEGFVLDVFYRGMIVEGLEIGREVKGERKGK
jgi:hypothetical protein